MKINVLWDRVTGPDLDPGNKKRAERNSATMKNDVFLQACYFVGIEPTRRQASKFNRKKGKAYSSR